MRHQYVLNGEGAMSIDAKFAQKLDTLLIFSKTAGTIFFNHGINLGIEMDDVNTYQMGKFHRNFPRSYRPKTEVTASSFGPNSAYCSSLTYCDTSMKWLVYWMFECSRWSGMSVATNIHDSKLI